MSVRIDVLEIEAAVAQRDTVAASLLQTLERLAAGDSSGALGAMRVGGLEAAPMAVRLDAPPQILGASIAHAVWSTLSERGGPS